VTLVGTCIIVILILLVIMFGYELGKRARRDDDY